MKRFNSIAHTYTNQNDVNKEVFCCHLPYISSTSSLFVGTLLCFSLRVAASFGIRHHLFFSIHRFIAYTDYCISSVYNTHMISDHDIILETGGSIG